MRAKRQRWGELNGAEHAFSAFERDDRSGEGQGCLPSPVTLALVVVANLASAR